MKITKKVRNLVKPTEAMGDYRVTMDLETLWEAQQIFRDKRRLKAVRQEALRQMRLAMMKFGMVMYLIRQKQEKAANRAKVQK